MPSEFLFSARNCTAAVLCLMLSACGGGGGGGGGGSGSGSGSTTGITVTATITPNSAMAIGSQTTQVESGETVTIDLTPASGFVFESVEGCGGTLVDTTYTTGAVTASCEVNAVFSPVPTTFNLTASAIKNFTFEWPAAEQATHYRLLRQQKTTGEYLRYGDDIDASETSITINVPLWRDVNALYKLQTCVDSVCADSEAFLVDQDLTPAIGYLKGQPDLNDGDEFFGRSVGISADGTIAVVGADQKLIENGAEGAAFVFTLVNGQWQQQTMLTAPNYHANAAFGYRAVISDNGRTMAIAAIGENSTFAGTSDTAQTITPENDPNYVGSIGAVYVFEISGGNWEPTAYLKPQVETQTQINYLAEQYEGDPEGIETYNLFKNFGESLAISGDGTVIAVGMKGAAFTYQYTGSEWQPQDVVFGANSAGGTPDNIGDYLALNYEGTTLALGAPQDDSGANTINGDENNQDTIDSGAVYLFNHANGAWSQQAYIKASSVESGEHFGLVSLSGDGTTLAVGALSADTGSAYVYVSSEGQWSEQAALTPVNSNFAAAYGLPSLSYDGNQLMISSYGEQSNAVGFDGNSRDGSAPAAGAVYSYTRDDGVWGRNRYIKAPNTDAGDNFGIALAVSADGNTLIVGATGEDSSASGVSGNQQDNAATDSMGAAYLY